MYSVKYSVLTDFIAEKCSFPSKGIEFVSIHTGSGTWRRYHLDNPERKINQHQFYVENIPDQDCVIGDITNVKGTNRITIKIIQPKAVDGKLDNIKTVSDLVKIISPNCIPIVVDNGTTISYPVDSNNKAEIKSVEIKKERIVIHTKF